MYPSVWFRVKLHVKDAKSVVDKKRYVAFWLERYAKREPGMPLTVVFDMSESSISNIVSKQTKLNCSLDCQTVRFSVSTTKLNTTEHRVL